MTAEPCASCQGARLVGWSGAGPILCPGCSRGKDAFTVVTQAWREQRNEANALREDVRRLTRAISEAKERGRAVERADVIADMERERSLMVEDAGGDVDVYRDQLELMAHFRKKWMRSGHVRKG